MNGFLFITISIFLAICTFAQKNNDDGPKTGKRSEIHYQQKEFSDPQNFAASISNEKTKLVFQAEGDLNGDGLKDWAGVFTIKKIDKDFDENAEITLNRLFILTQNKAKKYVVAEKSKEGCAEVSVCWVEGLEIKNSSVYLNVFSKSDAPTGSDYQFRLRDGKWQLIGYKTSKGFPADEKTGTDSSVVIDRNLLTGNIIEKTQIGEKQPKIKRSKKKFSELLLRDFEFYYVNENEFPAEDDSENIEN